MSENKKNEDNIKNLIVSFSEWSDIDAFLELLLLIKNTNASILVLLAVSKTYGVDKNVISYEEVITILNKLQLDKNEFNTKFNELVPHNDKDGYLYSTIHNSIDVIKYIIYIITKTFEKFRKSKFQKLYIRYATDDNEIYTGECNPFGSGWIGEHQILKSFIEEIGNISMPDHNPNPDFNDFSAIYLHLSGSCPVMIQDPSFISKLFADIKKIKMISIMGGTDSSQESKILKLNFLIRDVFATMNQRYSSQSFEKLMNLIKNENMIKVVVTNNIVNNIASFVNYDKTEFMDFIIHNVLDMNLDLSDSVDSMTYSLINNYYSVEKKFSWKIFDVLSAMLIVTHINNQNDNDFIPNATLFTEGINGNTIVDNDSENKLSDKLKIVNLTIEDGTKVRVFNPPSNSKFFDKVRNPKIIIC